MKKWCMVIGVCVLMLQLKAQTLAEFTQQKKTQIKYLLAQIAALKVYLGYVKKGYGIAQKGLTVIHDIKNGDFNLHSDYFSSLVKVSPKVKTYTKVATITTLQLQMVKQYHSSFSNMKRSGWFSSEEINYVFNVFTNLLANCSELISQLILITTDGQVQMTDDERLKRIDQLYLSAMDQYSFEQHFSNSIQTLALQRAKEHKEVKTIQTLYGVE